MRRNIISVQAEAVVARSDDTSRLDKVDNESAKQRIVVVPHRGNVEADQELGDGAQNGVDEKDDGSHHHQGRMVVLGERVEGWCRGRVGRHVGSCQGINILGFCGQS